MVTVLALDHIVLVTPDIERALAWYGRHLGLAGVRVEEWRRGEVPFPSLRVGDDTIIDLLAGEPAGAPNLDHLCFVVSPEDLATLEADDTLTIVDQGMRFGARGDGRSIYVHDPDGLTVEIRAYA